MPQSQLATFPNFVISRLISVLFTLVSLLPLGTVRAIGNMLGALAYKLDIELVKVTRRNLHLCYPELPQEQIEALSRASIQHTFIFGFEACLIWKRDSAWFNSVIHGVDGEQLLTRAIAEGNGVVILGPHLGNWEVIGKKLPEYAEVLNLYAPPRNTVLEDVIKAGRESSGAKLVPTTSRGIAKILKHLKTGGLTGILPDQVPAKGSGEYSEFFGITALTMTLVHGLITRTNCKVLISAAIRQENGFKISFQEPDQRIYSDDLSISLLGLNKSVEQIIALAPAQYQWEYKRFKRQKTKQISYYDF